VDALLAALSVHGPTAIMAGFLMWQVVKAWSADRSALINLLTEFRATLEGLKLAVERLSDRLE
jgi:hypothetical protein